MAAERASDRQRLARVFGFEPFRPWGPLVGTGVLAIIPATWLAAGGLGVGIVALIVDEQRRIAEGLREIEAWGFRVEGYRAWLLADTPTFEIELRRDVAIELIKGSIAAVDPSIVAERRGDRIVRVVMLRVEMEGGEGQPTFLVGDRKRLFEVHARVLAPLHADVGIVAMRMGDRDTLTALVASPAAATADAAFREQALVAPPDLQSLAHAGVSQRRPPQEARALKLRTDRLLYASGHVPASSGTLMGVLIGGMIVGGTLGVALGLGGALGLLAGSTLSTFGVWFVRGGDKARLRRALGSVTQSRGYPIEGYDNWLLSGRPILDVELAKPVPEHELAELLGATNSNLDVTWLSDQIVRIESAPVMHMAAQGIKSFWGGNPTLFALLDERVIAPLDAKYGVVAVRMGGYLDRHT